MFFVIFGNINYKSKKKLIKKAGNYLLSEVFLYCFGYGFMIKYIITDELYCINNHLSWEGFK